MSAGAAEKTFLRPEALRRGLRAAGLAVVAAVALGSLSGCALLLDAASGSRYRAPREFEGRISGLHSLAVVPPDVAVHRVSAGGVREEVDVWTAAARRNVLGAFERYFARRGDVALKQIEEPGAAVAEERSRPAGPRLGPEPGAGEDLQPSADAASPGADPDEPLETTRGLLAAAAPQQPEQSTTASRFTPIDEVWALYGAVGSSIYWHTYNSQNLFPQKIDDFDYTLGSWVGDVAAPYDADGLLLIVAEDNISTAGRKALLGVEFLLTAPLGQPVPAGAGTAVVSVALVESRTGDILWFNVTGSHGNLDLRDPDDADELVSRLLEEFPS